MTAERREAANHERELMEQRDHLRDQVMQLERDVGGMEVEAQHLRNRCAHLQRQGCHFTPGGRVWHAYHDCQALSQARHVESKESLCCFCGQRLFEETGHVFN